MRLPHVGGALVPEAKLTEYLLTENHPEGHSKARFLVQRGFSRADPATRRKALLELERTTDMSERPFEYGIKYAGSGPLRCPDGSLPPFVTVWVLVDGTPPPLLVNVYPGAGRRWSE